MFEPWKSKFVWALVSTWLGAIVLYKHTVTYIQFMCTDSLYVLQSSKVLYCSYVIRSVCDIPSVNSEPRFLSLTGIAVSITVPAKYTWVVQDTHCISCYLSCSVHMLILYIVSIVYISKAGSLQRVNIYCFIAPQNFK